MLPYLFYALLGFLSGSILYSALLPRWLRAIDLLAASDDPNRTYIQEILPEKLRLDLSYIPRAGVVQDIALIFETLAVVIRG